MKYTLLRMVQLILSSMDSDNVNSITDTVESVQVADVIESVYYDIVSRSNLPEHFSFYELDPSNDSTKPTLMYMPSTVLDIAWIKYDNKLTGGTTGSDFQPVYYKDMDDFVNTMLALDISATNIAEFTHTVGTASINFKYINDKFPEYYTTFDDNTLVFDSYKATEDTTLVGNKTMVYGQTKPTFSKTDAFVADLDPKQFSLFFNESKALAFAELKQTPHGSAERGARRGWIQTQKSKRGVPTPYSPLHRLPNFGRK